MNNIGILGGSFDPFHYGHLSIGNLAADEFDLTKVILLPAQVSPFKVGRKMADTEHRVNMLRLVAENNKNLEVSTFEAESSGVSYTYKTLTALKRLAPNDKFNFIMGTDSLFSLEDWYKGKDLLREFAFIIGTRPGFDKEAIESRIKHYEEKYGADIKVMHNNMLEISSTKIKKNIKEGKSIAKLVPPCIEEYINEHGLYK